MESKPLLQNNRFYVLMSSAVVALAVWAIATMALEGVLRATRLAETYAFLALIYLYVALLATPLTRIWATMPGRGAYLHARRGIGVSAFFFALLHAPVSFGGQLGGLEEISFLTSKYLTGVILGFGALLILAMLAGLSFDAAIRRLTFPRWKRLQRSIYGAGVLTLVHILMVGSHYMHRLTPIAVLTSIMFIVLLALEAPRLRAPKGSTR